MEEKNRRVQELSFADKLLQEQIEAERKQAEEMAEERQIRMKQFNKDYRWCKIYNFGINLFVVTWSDNFYELIKLY